MSKHTPEPWVVGGVRSSAGIDTDQLIRNSDRDPVASVQHMGWDTKTAKANARRIVACVNACKGIDIEALDKGVIDYGRVALDFDTARTGLAAIIVALDGDDGSFGHDTALQTARDTLARLDQA